MLSSGSTCTDRYNEAAAAGVSAAAGSAAAPLAGPTEGEGRSDEVGGDDSSPQMQLQRRMRTGKGGRPTWAGDVPAHNLMNVDNGPSPVGLYKLNSIYP
jgi:hypothetical protein